jgi:hypothetical protein
MLPGFLGRLGVSAGGSLSIFNMGYGHEYVNHSLWEYARGDVHINNCGNRTSILSPWPSLHIEAYPRTT